MGTDVGENFLPSTESFKHAAKPCKVIGDIEDTISVHYEENETLRSVSRVRGWAKWRVFSQRDLEHARSRWLAFFPPPLTESTSNSRAVFFAGATRTLLLLLPRQEQRCHCSAYSSLPCLLASHWSKQDPAIYSHYLKVMMRVNKFHAASGTNCPEVTKKNAAVIRAALGDVAGDWDLGPSNCSVASSCQCPSPWSFLHVLPSNCPAVLSLGASWLHRQPTGFNHLFSWLLFL